MASTAAKSFSVCGSKLDDTAQLFALKAALSLHYYLTGVEGINNKVYCLKGVAVFCIN
jgi:hypothetical protein